jgi:hypothetical protein
MTCVVPRLTSVAWTHVSPAPLPALAPAVPAGSGSARPRQPAAKAPAP